MSFPRAKINRFNDVKNCTPSPADYNVKVPSRTVSGVIPQSERFTEPQSPIVSETGSCVSVNCSLFRTPTRPKKLKQPTASAQKLNAKDFFVNPQDLETLKEKIVELNNKDVYLKDLVEQIEEMKMKTCELEQLNSKLVKDNAKLKSLERKHLAALEHMKETQAKAEVELLNQIQGVRDIHKQLSDEHSQMTQDVAEEIYKFQDVFNNTCRQLELYEVRVAELQVQYDELIKKHKAEIEKLIELHRKETEDLQYETLRTVEKEREVTAQLLKAAEKQRTMDVKELQKEFEEEKAKLLADGEAKLRQIEEDLKEANILSEINMKQKFEEATASFESKLQNQTKEFEKIMKDCQTISEYNIIQCEIEKNQVKADLSKKTKQNEELVKEKQFLLSKQQELEVTHKNLQECFQKTSKDLQEVREHLSKQIELNRQQTQNNANIIHSYELSISKFKETTETLKRRLINSDNDVIQLKKELEECEEVKVKFESRCTELTDEIDRLNTHIETQELDNEATLKLTEEKVQKVKAELLELVDEYSENAQEVQKRLENALEEKIKLLADRNEFINEQQKLNTDAQQLLIIANREIERWEITCTEYAFIMERLKGKIATFKNTIDKLQDENRKLLAEKDKLSQILEEKDKEIMKLREDNESTKLNMENVLKQLLVVQEKSESYYQYCEYYKAKAEDYEKEIDEFADVRKKYIEQSGKYDDTLQKLEEMERKNVELEKTVKLQELLIGPFKKQLEQYEFEHQMLVNEKCDAETEVKSIALKYASILGHQNHKQKIKHLVDLKAKNIELSQDKAELEMKVRTQSKTIEKLKKELKGKGSKKSIMEDKENDGSILNTSHCESPGPFRERN